MTTVLNETLEYLALNLARGLGAALDRQSYLYWPYLLSSVALAVIAWRWLSPSVQPGKRWSEFFARYFNGKLWWHPSAQADYWLYLVNALVVPLVFGFLLIDERVTTGLLAQTFGVQTIAATEPSAAAKIAFTLVFFVAYDFGRFVAHCLLHDVPLLWEFHKIHHSAEVLTPMTSFRAHPAELVLMAWGPLVSTAIATLLFNMVTGVAVTYYSFLGVHAVLFASNLIGNLRHSPVWISYGPHWGRWLVSPAHHQLHHSCEPQHVGCNRGFELAVWDRLYGTLLVPETRQPTFRLGLGDGTEYRYRSVHRMYLQPFFDIGAKASAALRRRRLPQ
jgi:sterol desaturase/sphingolipid hydroxylase (fatty acid hydroxylase superfamily)